MKDSDCVEFLQWALPQLRMRWPGFRKVRRQVGKRIDRRLRELSLPNAAAYRAWFEQHPEEWHVLDDFCRISISRFYRDRAVFDALRTVVLPEIARQAMSHRNREIRCWSAGCASGEEPYTLSIVWRLDVQPLFPDVRLQIIATDEDETLLARARAGCYSASTLKDLPAEWCAAAFVRKNNVFRIADDFQAGIEFIKQDIRVAQPAGLFHLILCRNLVFTYFNAELQTELLAKIAERLLPRGCLVIGIHESLPPIARGLRECFPRTGIYEKRPAV